MYNFQNWMRTAAVPTFSKLYMRNDNQSMVAGQYQVKIGLNYDVTKWNGRKSFQISSLSLIGGRNLVLQSSFRCLETMNIVAMMAHTVLMIGPTTAPRSSSPTRMTGFCGRGNRSRRHALVRWSITVTTLRSQSTVGRSKLTRRITCKRHGIQRNI